MTTKHAFVTVLRVAALCAFVLALGPVAAHAVDASRFPQILFGQAVHSCDQVEVFSGAAFDSVDFSGDAGTDGMIATVAAGTAAKARTGRHSDRADLRNPPEPVFRLMRLPREHHSEATTQETR